MKSKGKVLLLILLIIVLLLAVKLFSTNQELTNVKQEQEIEKQKSVLDNEAEEFLIKLYEGEEEHLTYLSKDALSRTINYKEENNSQEGKLNDTKLTFYITKTDYKNKKFHTTSYYVVENENSVGYTVDKVFLAVTIEWVQENDYKVDRYDFQLVTTITNDAEINSEI